MNKKFSYLFLVLLGSLISVGVFTSNTEKVIAEPCAPQVQYQYIKK